MPVAPTIAEVPHDYYDMRDTIIAKIKDTRVQMILQANSGMIILYWEIGNEILRRQENEGWGAKVIDRLSKDLKEAFSEMSGFSPRNLGSMKKFAEIWTDNSILQQVVAKIPWRSNIVLMDKLQDTKSRLWYAEKLIENGWSSNVLDLMISSRTMERSGKAVNNFSAALPLPDSDMAREMFKDPYLFDCMGTDALRRETDIERSLIEHIEKFLLELGRGFAFVGRQVHLEVGGDDFFIDLLFYHLKLRRYVVVELKTGRFEPGFLGQLNMYQNAVNDVLRHPEDGETIGLLLVKGKNRTVVEYSLTGFKNPIGVADWQEQLEEELQVELRSSLPTVEEIERELDSKEYIEKIRHSK
ncbi:MAG: PDDEXK nuclease domain-containing protein [Methanomassiliicoccaceae archaeon]|nr:PDDEXK nuclease domain-containing protein [Methanomassiliicoccaceae archaeon]